MLAPWKKSFDSVLKSRDRVPADERARLPLVAAGARVVWFPGLRAEEGAASEAACRYVALAVEPAGGRA